MNRILLLIKGLGRGGAEQLLVNAAPYVDKDRFAYQVAYLLPWKDALVGELEETGIPSTCLDGSKGIGWIRKLKEFVKSEGIDLIHIHSPYAAVGARVSLNGKLPMVYTEHNMWERYRKITYWGNMLTFGMNDHVFAVSETVRTSIRYPRPFNFLQMPPAETLYQGIDPNKTDPCMEPVDLEATFGIPRNKKVVGTIANFKPHKGHPFLLRAAQLVIRRQPDAHFLLVGQGPTLSAMRALARHLGIERHVTFAGFREDAVRITRAVDVFVLPSLQEGLPIALLEAMALGCPIVATDAGGIPEVVENGRTALLVPPKDQGALAHAIVTVLTNDAVRERLASTARSEATRYDISRTVTRTEDMYGKLLTA